MRIRALVAIAAAHDSSISTDELFLLLPKAAFSSEPELQAYICSDPILRDEISVHRSEIAPKGSEELARRRGDRISLFARRSELAQSFSDRLTEMCPWVRLVGISGSTAYRGPKLRDDIDFFIVTSRDRVWITLLIAMLAARIWRKGSLDSTVLCFNRIIEEDDCRDAFGSMQDPLFAREALSLNILFGREYYRNLLSASSWMERLFPALFHEAIRPSSMNGERNDHRPRHWESVLNGVSVLVLAPYLRIMGYWRNIRLLRAGNRDAQFRTVIRRGFFAYESRKYDLLRDAYRQSFHEA